MESMTPVKRDLLNKAVYEYQYAVYVLQNELLRDLGTINRTDYLEFFYDNEEILERLIDIGTGVEEFEDIMDDLNLINELKRFIYENIGYYREEYENYTSALIMFAICLALKELNISDPLKEAYHDKYVYQSEELLNILDFAVNYYDTKQPLTYSKVKAYVQDIFLG